LSAQLLTVFAFHFHRTARRDVIEVAQTKRATIGLQSLVITEITWLQHFYYNKCIDSGPTAE